jgi:hypothetical protein
MEVFLLLLNITLIFGHFAGQIYLISKAIKRFGNGKIILSIIVGIFAFISINIPAIITSFYVEPISFLETFILNKMIIVFAIWVLGISLYGIGCFFNDYWQLYKKYKNKNETTNQIKT